jgi:tetratricopeptide (TPR) repeat protein
LGAYKDAENCYVQALRISSFSGRPLEDPLVLLRMGSLYNAQKLYGEAAVIFEECFIKFPNNSFSLLNYGVTLIYNNKQPNYESAVKYLSRAN